MMHKCYNCSMEVNSTNINIRKAEEADIGLIQDFGSKLLNFERENYDSSLDANWAFSEEARKKYLEAIREKYTIIAECDKKPVGFLIANIIDLQPGNARLIKQANLQNIYVDEAYRSLGVGEKLVNCLKEYCTDYEVNRLNVSVLAENDVAIHFYQKVGFIPRSINYYQEIDPQKS